MVDVGDPLPDLAVQIRDSSGVLASAGAVALTLTLPDNTSVTPAVSQPSTGLYQANYITTQAGRHVGRWVATGANASAYTQFWDVRPADPGGIVSLADVKRHLNKTSTADDEELRGVIDAVTDLIELEVGPVLRRVRADTVYGTWDLWLPYAPVISLTSVASFYGNVPVTVGDLTLESEWGRVSRTNGGPIGYSSPWLVNYTAGRIIIPASITQAAYVTIEHLWQSQLGGSASVRLGGAATTEEFAPAPTAFALPRKAMELLAPHRRLPSVI